VKTKRPFVFIMISILLVGGPSCGPSKPAATPAPQVTPAPTAAASTTLTPTRMPGQASDTTPPHITEIRVEEANYDHFGVFWKTYEPTIGRLEYGLAPDINLSSPWTAELRTAGGVTQTALVPYTTYFFRVRVKNAAGNETVTRDLVVTLILDYESVYIYGRDVL